jgi:hypothetical protein
MSYQKFSGILNEVLKRYPNIDTVDFLEFELGIPRFKAEALAERIEERYCKRAPVKTAQKIQRLFEKQDDPESPPEESVYSVGYLSSKEFENFICWVFEELGYELQPERYQTGFGFTVVAAKGCERVAIEAVRCPKTYRISNPIIRITEETKRKYGCSKSIVVATSSFTQQAIEDAQKADVELWNQAILTQKVAEAKKREDTQVQSRFPPYQGTLLQSLLRLKDGKDFLLETKADGKYDLFLPGVKYPLLTFQAQDDSVTRCIFRIKYNEPVNESEGEAVIASCGGGDRIGYDDMKVYTSIIQYLEQFLE